jgi:hypothetical protein
MKKKILIGLAIFFGLLLITNPSVSDFKENGHFGACYRDSNWLLFSIYSSQIEHQKTIYLGICKNFIELDHEWLVY